jgi:hypothetical protein
MEIIRCGHEHLVGEHLVDERTDPVFEIRFGVGQALVGQTELPL